MEEIEVRALKIIDRDQQNLKREYLRLTQIPRYDECENIMQAMETIKHNMKQNEAVIRVIYECGIFILGRTEMIS